MSAIGSVGRHYVQNRRELADYRAAVEAGGSGDVPGCRLTADDALRRAVIGNLLCHGVVVKARDRGRATASRSTTTSRTRSSACSPAPRTGWWSSRADEIRATPLGRVFLRNLAMPFDAYLGAGPEKPVFSRTL